MFWDMGQTKHIISSDNAKTGALLALQHGLQGSVEAIDLTVGCCYPCQTLTRPL
jgi:hypothetical protein